MGEPDRRAELDEGPAERRDRQGDADGEHGTGSRQGRAEQPVPPVPLLPLAGALPVLPAARGVPAPDRGGQETPVRRCVLTGVPQARR